MAVGTGKEFQLPNVSKAATMDHVPCNSHGFAHGQRSNNMGLGLTNNLPPFANTQSHLIFPLARPSPLRMYYENNYMNGLGAMGSAAAISHYSPLANNLVDGTSFPTGNPNNPTTQSMRSNQTDLL
ncbi:hypothetical protein TIFTF001_001379 [Ficus carica]|uniref:Uncharacterized protein n=1 Tax=Ficus carica TaxID=3494 RepID=A0AA87YZN0_FICCA|nr:hypothetical protein TIFTF001_001379 [Ficus carica]